MTSRRSASTGAKAALLALTMLVAAGPTAHATEGDGPTDGVTRTELQRLPSPTPGFDIVQTRVEIPVCKESGRHSHPGPEVGYIIAGDVDIVFDDGPTEHLHTGEPFLIPTGVVHNAVNVGDVRTMMLSTYVIDANQPLVSSRTPR
jgi:quercetin dioxygenase-like cupin family protein